MAHRAQIPPAGLFNRAAAEDSMRIGMATVLTVLVLFALAAVGALVFRASFGPTHSDAELKSLVAFVRHLPALGTTGYLDAARAAGLTPPPGQARP